MLPVALCWSPRRFCQRFNPREKRTVKEENGGITPPKGFKAVVVADNLGTVRHIVIPVQWRPLQTRPVKNGKGILRLRDTNKDGVVDEIIGWAITAVPALS